MTIARPALLRRIQAVVDATPSRIPVLLGGCGSGRSSLARELQARIGVERCQYIDLERVATTPERFHRVLCLQSPFLAADVPLATPTPRAAFDATLAFLTGARAPDGSPATFLIDEALEFRTFENFPGLRHIMRDLLGAILTSSNRFVLTTRYVSRALRLLRDAAPRFEVIHVPPLDPLELRQAVQANPTGLAAADMARAIHALTDGHTGHAHALLAVMTELSRQGGSDPVSALAAAFEPGAPLASRVGWSLRAAPASRTRVWRAQGHSRHPGRRRAAHSHRDRTAPAAHARVDEGLPLVAGGRGPRQRAAEALHVCRSLDAALGPHPLPSRAADRGSDCERGAPVRARTPAPGAASPGAGRGRSLCRRRAKNVGHHRDRLTPEEPVRKSGDDGFAEPTTSSWRSSCVSTVRA